MLPNKPRQEMELNKIAVCAQNKTRVKILEWIFTQNSARPAQVRDEFGISYGAAMDHLKKLKAAGLVKGGPNYSTTRESLVKIWKENATFVARAEASPIKMAGKSRVLSEGIAIHNDFVYEWVGIGWVKLRTAEKEDFQKIPILK